MRDLTVGSMARGVITTSLQEELEHLKSHSSNLTGLLYSDDRNDAMSFKDQRAILDEIQNMRQRIMQIECMPYGEVVKKRALTGIMIDSRLNGAMSLEELDENTKLEPWKKLVIHQ